MLNLIADQEFGQLPFYCWERVCINPRITLTFLFLMNTQEWIFIKLGLHIFSVLCSHWATDWPKGPSELESSRCEYYSLLKRARILGARCHLRIESCHHSLLGKSIEIKDKLLQKECSGQVFKNSKEKNLINPTSFLNNSYC